MSLRLSIIICTKNRSTDLEITLRSIYDQSILPDNLVIIDDGNPEETRDILNFFNSSTSVKIIYFHPEPRCPGLPAARNIGIKQVPDMPDIILFLDDDVTLEKTYLETILDLFNKNPDVCGITGFCRNKYHCRSLPVKGLYLITGCIIPSLIPVSLYTPRVTRTAEALYPIFQKNGTGAVTAQWLSGCNMAYRSLIFKEGSAFDEQLTGYALGEDMLFSHRLFQKGKKLLLSYNALLTHRMSVEGRIPPFRKLVMIYGYRRYAISQFIDSHRSGSCWYTVFVIQCILSSVISSIRYGKGLALVKEVIRAYNMTKEFEQEIGSGKLKRFNEFLSERV